MSTCQTSGMVKNILGIVAFTIITAASAQKTQTVYINGQPVQAISVTVGGKAYTQLLTNDLIKTGALTQAATPTSRPFRVARARRSLMACCA